MSANVVVETRDRVTRIEIARLDKKNALTLEMYAAIGKALSAAEADPQVRAMLIHGKPDCFTAGNDLKDFLERPPHGERSITVDFLHQIADLNKPLVAAVGGAAVGIGTTMLLHCDLVYAAPNARFQLPFVPLGLVPEAGSSLLLPAIAGYQRAAELLMLGQPFGADKALAAELIEVSSEPFTRKVVIAKGSRDGGYVGQPVIDAHGIMGQVTQVADDFSRVTLITDAGHAIPVLDNRSGLRTIVFGTGDPDILKVPYLTASADIKQGDLLVSSGMGGTFPPGYPVAHVVKIANDPNEPFLTIGVKPAALLNHGKQVLLIWRGNPPRSRGNRK